MLNEIINRIKDETEKLKFECDEIEKNKKIYSTIIKIINEVNVSDEEVELFKEYIYNQTNIDSNDSETLEFITSVLLPYNEKLDQNQINVIIKLKNNYNFLENKIIFKKYERNNMVLEQLQNNGVFIYFDELFEILSECNYSIKEKYNIINSVIKNNFQPFYNQVKEETVIEEVITPICENTQEKIADDKKESLEETDTLMYDYKSYSLDKVLSEIVSNNDPIDFSILSNFFKKYKLNYNSIPKELMDIICKSNIDFEKLDRIFDILIKNDFNIKSLYSRNYRMIINLILFANEDNLNKVIQVSKIHKISLKKIFRKDINYIISEKNGGRFEELLRKVGLLENYNYDFEVIDPLFVDYNTLKNSCELIKMYKLKHQISFILILVISDFYLPILDRMIEIDKGIVKHVYEQPDFRGILFDKEAYNTKISTTTLLKTGEICKSNEEYTFKREFSELEIQLNNLFGKLKYKENILIVPLDVEINESLNDNEYVRYLNENYLNGLDYLINDTSVSRIKVMRVLSYIAKHNIEITEEVVKYAMKFNYVFAYNDLENIDNAFKEKKNGGVQCQKK